MKYRRITLLLIYSFFICFRGECQPIKSAISEYFNDYKVNRLNTNSLSQIGKVVDKVSILDYFTPYQNDSLPGIRAEAYRLIGNLSSQEKDKKESSQKYIKRLLQGLTDNSMQVNATAIKHLIGFKPTYFEKADVNFILKSTRKSSAKGDFFKLLGYVGSSSILDSLKGYEQLVVSQEESWALKLALSRLGDSTSISFVSEAFDNATKSSTEFIKLLPDFSYVKNRQIINKMVEVVVDEKLKCRSLNPSSTELIPCSYYTIPYLYYSIANFPVEVDSFGEIIDDYGEAMKKLVEWKKAKGETYLIQIYSYK